jgi:hypothetical protein
MGESHGIGDGPAGLGGAGWPAAAGAAGLAAVVAGLASAEGTACAGFGGVAGVAGLSAGVFVSGCEEPVGLAFTAPKVAGLSAVGFGSPSGGGDEGDLVSSGIARERGKPPARAAFAKNDNFYQLEEMVSTRVIDQVVVL